MILDKKRHIVSDQVVLPAFTPIDNKQLTRASIMLDSTGFISFYINRITPILAYSDKSSLYPSICIR
jgi:hypothetical protein